MAETKDIQVKDKQEVAGTAEQTRPGPVFSPEVDIFETEKELVLLADMPGVDAKDLSIDLRDDTLTITGEVASEPVGSEETPVIVEYRVGKYIRQFSLSEVIDQSAIDAKLDNGVLRLNLPKVKKAAPRKITVTT